MFDSQYTSNFQCKPLKLNISWNSSALQPWYRSLSPSSPSSQHQRQKCQYKTLNPQSQKSHSAFRSKFSKNSHQTKQFKNIRVQIPISTLSFFPSHQCERQGEGSQKSNKKEPRNFQTAYKIRKKMKNSSNMSQYESFSQNQDIFDKDYRKGRGLKPKLNHNALLKMKFDFSMKKKYEIVRKQVNPLINKTISRNQMYKKISVLELAYKNVQKQKEHSHEHIKRISITHSQIDLKNESHSFSKRKPKKILSLGMRKILNSKS